MSQHLDTANLNASSFIGSATGLKRTGNVADLAARSADRGQLPAPRSTPDLPQIRELVATVKDSFQRNETTLEIDVSEGPPEQLVVSIVDRETGEVVRQFPSEELVQLARNLHRHNTGLLHEQA